MIGPALTVDQALQYIDSCPDLDGVVLDVRLGEEMSYPVADVLVERHVPFLFATAFPDWAIRPPMRGCPAAQAGRSGRGRDILLT